MSFAILHVQTCIQRVYFYIISQSQIARSYPTSVFSQVTRNAEQAWKTANVLKISSLIGI